MTMAPDTVQALPGLEESRRAARADAQAPTRRHVCMLAYTDYAIDARVRREAETLAARGFVVRCLTTRSGDCRRRFTLNGVWVQELPIAKYRGKSTAAYAASYLAFTIAAAAVCAGLLVRRRLDVVHAHNIPNFVVLAGLVPRLLGVRVVLDVHDSVVETFAAKFPGNAALAAALRCEERVSALVAHKVICVNHPQRDTLVARGIPADKTFVSMNVPDPSIFGVGDVAKAHRGADTLNLVYHGTMAERLGVDLLIRAVGRVRERVPGVRLHLWGHGDDLPAFVRLVSQLELQDAVRFNPKGFPLHELPAELAAMDLGVVGNRRNAATELMLPVKLLEYVARGIPVIAPRLSTIAYYFAEDMVAYYEPEDVESLAETICRLCHDPGRRADQAQRAHVFLALHGWERQGADFGDWYCRLAGRAS